MASKKIIAPDATTNVEMMLNLNGYDKPITKTFSFLKHADNAAPYVLNPETFNSVVSLNISDMQGTNHVFSTYFSKTNIANEWNAYVFIDDRNIEAAIGRNFFVMDASERTVNSTILSKGEITANPLKISFNEDGKLSDVQDYSHDLKVFSVDGSPFMMTRVFFDNVDLSAINPTLKTTPFDIAIDFANSTQFAMPFTAFNLQQTWLLTGTTENDILVGSSNNDTIIGSSGVDTMTGGMGADIFSFYNAEETGLTTKTRDIIVDFKHWEGDKIDLSAIDANETNVNNFGLQPDESFTFIGSQAFSKTDATGQLRFDATTHILYGSTDADSKAEFSIRLNGVNELIADDFVL